MGTIASVGRHTLTTGDPGTVTFNGTDPADISGKVIRGDIV